MIPVVLGKDGQSSVSLSAAQDKLVDGAGQPHIALPILMQVGSSSSSSSSKRRTKGRRGDDKWMIL